MPSRPSPRESAQWHAHPAPQAPRPTRPRPPRWPALATTPSSRVPSGLQLRQIMLGNLAPGCPPYAGMAADVFERRVERADAVRHAADVGMQRDRHDPAGRFAFAIEHVEGPADHA